ncbi:gas vesicle protein K [Roseomonas frigidaquae]|uniref:Gas vesicle protein K n=1 Tax=Falsiroseomonas frigidaquae TaxID=487318 RepID=A0ABX1EUI8_9PROT|nr:gas vesicle protein K [Falsiroseomonas frigidaquae]NKE44252.1 gas vesicle protein K [Falsiroseomonas frigidaquae]
MSGLHAGPPPPPVFRFALDPADAERDLARLVLTLVELVRRLLETQALRRMEAGTVTEDEVERLGTALMQTRGAVLGLCDRLGLQPEELNLDLGPLGRLL